MTLYLPWGGTGRGELWTPIVMEEGRYRGGHKWHDGEGNFLIKRQTSVFVGVLVLYSSDAISWSKQKSGLRDVKK